MPVPSSMRLDGSGIAMGVRRKKPMVDGVISTFFSLDTLSIASRADTYIGITLGWNYLSKVAPCVVEPAAAMMMKVLERLQLTVSGRLVGD
jgi:hypothetical protein